MAKSLLLLTESCTVTSAKAVWKSVQNNGPYSFFKKDRRTNLIHLTKTGKELEEKARLIANRTLMEALQGITVEELSVSQEVLRKIFFNTKD